MKRVTSLRGPSPRHVAAVASRSQHCVRFDRPEISTSDLSLQRRTCYRSTIWPVERKDELHHYNFDKAFNIKMCTIFVIRFNPSFSTIRYNKSSAKSLILSTILQQQTKFLKQTILLVLFRAKNFMLTVLKQTSK